MPAQPKLDTGSKFVSVKGIFGRLKIHQPTQNAVLSQQAIQLARHEGTEVADLRTIAEPGPFTVRARQHATAAGWQGRPPYLDFFSTHHVKLAARVNALETRCDVQLPQRLATVTRVYRYCGQLRGGLRNGGRTIKVRRFFPALTAANHAAGHQGAVKLRDPVAAQCQQRPAELPIFDGHDATRGAARLNGMAHAVQQTGPQIGGAPVKCNKRRCGQKDVP